MLSPTFRLGLRLGVVGAGAAAGAFAFVFGAALGAAALVGVAGAAARYSLAPLLMSFII